VLRPEAGSFHRLGPCRAEADLQSLDERQSRDAGLQNPGVRPVLEVRQAAGEWGAWDAAQGRPEAAVVHIPDHRRWDRHRGGRGRKLGDHVGWRRPDAEERAQTAAEPPVEAEVAAPDKPVADRSGA
jgi:hypothetical protein